MATALCYWQPLQRRRGLSVPCPARRDVAAAAFPVPRSRTAVPCWQERAENLPLTRGLQDTSLPLLCKLACIIFADAGCCTSARHFLVQRPCVFFLTEAEPASGSFLADAPGPPAPRRPVPVFPLHLACGQPIVPKQTSFRGEAGADEWRMCYPAVWARLERVSRLTCTCAPSRTFLSHPPSQAL